MYGTDLPSSIKLLQADARVSKVGSLMFLLLGPKNYQMCPQRVKRIGWIALTVVQRADASTSIPKMAGIAEHNLVPWPLDYKMQTIWSL